MITCIEQNKAHSFLDSEELISGAMNLKSNHTHTPIPLEFRVMPPLFIETINIVLKVFFQFAPVRRVNSFTKFPQKLLNQMDKCLHAYHEALNTGTKCFFFLRAKKSCISFFYCLISYGIIHSIRRPMFNEQVFPNRRKFSFTYK